MKLGKTPRAIEFADLMAKLEANGISRDDVSRRIDKTTAAISMWLSGQRTPTANVIEVTRLFLKEVTGEPPGLHESNPIGDAIFWKHRATKAERDLANLKNALRRLVGEEPSCDPATVLNAAEAVARRELQQAGANNVATAPEPRQVPPSSPVTYSKTSPKPHPPK